MLLIYLLADVLDEGARRWVFDDVLLDYGLYGGGIGREVVLWGMK